MKGTQAFDESSSQLLAISAGASTESLGLSLAAAAIACALGSSIANGLGIPGFSLGLVAIIASALASLGAFSQDLQSSTDGSKSPAGPFKGKAVLYQALPARSS